LKIIKPINSGQVDWEIDDYTAQRLKELGLGEDEDDGLDLVSYVYEKEAHSKHKKEEAR
jgi:hypothetical protein